MFNLMIRIYLACFLGFVISCSATDDPSVGTEKETLVFNNDTQGGIGGDVIKVTNLNTKGEGSLRAALEAEGARLVVFEVGGVIDLEMGKITIKSPFITVAGQTAPSPGITIIRGGIFVTTHDVIIKHIAIRPGDAGQPKKSGWEPDGLSTFGENAYNILVDHCSLTWSVDENLSASGPRLEGPDHTSRHITFSNNIIAEALSNSSHAKGEHSKGTLIHDNCQDIAIIGNFYANNEDRNPYFKATTTGIIVNNLIYNTGTCAIRLAIVEDEWVDSPVPPKKPKVSVVGNVFHLGEDSRPNLPLIKNLGEVYALDNIALKPDMTTANLTDGDIKILGQKPVWMEGLKAMPANQVVDWVCDHVGSRSKERDSIDQRIINDFIYKRGKIIDSQEEVGGYPQYKQTYRKLDVPDDNIQDWLDKMEEAVL